MSTLGGDNHHSQWLIKAVFAMSEVFGQYAIYTNMTSSEYQEPSKQWTIKITQFGLLTFFLADLRKCLVAAFEPIRTKPNRSDRANSFLIVNSSFPNYLRYFLVAQN